MCFLLGLQQRANEAIKLGKLIEPIGTQTKLFHTKTDWKQNAHKWARTTRVTDNDFEVQAEPNQFDLAPETPTVAFRKDKVFHVFHPLFHFSHLLQDIFLAQLPRLTETRWTKDGLQNKDVFFHWQYEHHPTLYFYFTLTGTLAPHGSCSTGPWRTKCGSVCCLFLHSTEHHGPLTSNVNQTISEHSKPKNWYWYPRRLRFHRNDLFQSIVSTLHPISQYFWMVSSTKKTPTWGLFWYHNYAAKLSSMSSLWKPIWKSTRQIQCVRNAAEAVPLEAYRIHSALSRSFWQDWVWVARKCNVPVFQDFPFRWNDMDRWCWQNLETRVTDKIERVLYARSIAAGSLHSTYCTPESTKLAPRSRKKKKSTCCFGHGTADRWRSTTDQHLFNTSHVTSKIARRSPRNR